MPYDTGKRPRRLSATFVLTVRPGSTGAKRAAVVHEWHKALLHEAVRELIARWEPRLGVHIAGYYLQRMKTKWGSCNHRAGTIRLNTELVKKPKDLLEYVLIHELLHLMKFERDYGLRLPRWPRPSCMFRVPSHDHSAIWTRFLEEGAPPPGPPALVLSTEPRSEPRPLL